MVATITIVVELLFIYTQKKDGNYNTIQDPQLVKNNFMEFYQATLTNKTGS